MTPTKPEDALVEELRKPKQWSCIFEHEDQMRLGTTEAPFRAADAITTLLERERQATEALKLIERNADDSPEGWAASVARARRILTGEES